MIGPTDITAIFGQRGSGKSELGRAISKLYPRRVIIDVLKEWKLSEADLITDNVFSAFEFLLTTIGRKEWTLVFQFDLDTHSKERMKVFNALIRTIYKRGEKTGENVCLLIEEVHFYCTSGSTEEWLANCATTGRHANMPMVISSQRPAQVAKVLVSQAANIFCGSLHEKRDIEYLRQTIGDDADKIPHLEKYNFIYHRIGEPSQVVTREVFGV